MQKQSRSAKLEAYNLERKTFEEQCEHKPIPFTHLERKLQYHYEDIDPNNIRNVSWQLFVNLQSEPV